MGSILHIASQLSTEWTHLHPRAVFHKIERGEPVPLGAPGEQKWAVPHAITVVEKDEDRGGDGWFPPSPPTRQGARLPRQRVPLP